MYPLGVVISTGGEEVSFFVKTESERSHCLHFHKMLFVAMRLTASSQAKVGSFSRISVTSSSKLHGILFRCYLLHAPQPRQL